MINKHYLSELEYIIETTRINSLNSYVIGNQIYTITDSNKSKFNYLDPNDDTDLQIRSLLDQVGNHLYQAFHCRHNLNQQLVIRNENYFDNRNFVELLSNANTGIGTWEPGWEISKIEKNGKLVVKKNGLKIWILPYQFVPLDNNRIEVGKKGYLLMVKEFRELLSGFYMANGNMTMEENISIVRIYWNVRSDGAIPLMNNLTTLLNQEKIPFQFKILNNANYFIRADAGVLYMDKKILEKSIYSLSKIFNSIKLFLKADTPLFAKRLSSGISLAEDPENGESFGQNRSKILSEAFYEIYKKNISTKEEKIREVQKYFQAKNIDINRPYLKNIESLDQYEKMFNGLFN